MKNIQLRNAINLKNYTTIKVGGIAEYLLMLPITRDMVEVILLFSIIQNMFGFYTNYIHTVVYQNRRE